MQTPGYALCRRQEGGKAEMKGGVIGEGGQSMAGVTGVMVPWAALVRHAG